MYGQMAALLVVVSPIIFLVCLILARTGRDLTTLFLFGCAGLFCLGAFLIVLGLCRNRRASTLTGSGLLLVLLLTFSVCATSSALAWMGVETRELTVSVRDADTTEPIPEATVLLHKLYEKDDGLKETTGPKGTARLVRKFTSIGTDSLIQRDGLIYLWQDALEVHAEGYRSLGEPLDKFAGRTWDLYGPPLPMIEVRLKKLN
jgi:hypothetical protein